MRIQRLLRTQFVPRAPHQVFRFFADASNLEAITPGFLRFRILTPAPIEMRSGATIDYRLTLLGVPLRWRSLITEWRPGERFVDEQVTGPYAAWRHTHEFEAQGSGTLVRDSVEYAVPFGPLGRLADLLFVGRMLTRIFDFRRDAIQRAFAQDQDW